MPKLKLFREDPLNSDAIPFPRARRDEGFRLRLAGRDDDAVTAVEKALESVQSHLDDAKFLMSGAWFDDDGPRAA